jgi:hypothetical protein
MKRRLPKRATPSVSSTRTQSNIRLALIVIGFIILLLLLGQLFNFLGSLSKPITPGLLSQNFPTLSNHYSYNVAIKAKDIGIMNIDPINKKLTLLSLPDNTYLEVPKGYGWWGLDKVYELGQEQEPAIGAELLHLSLQNLIALPLDRLIIAGESDQTKTVSELVESWRSNPVFAWIGLRSIQSNFTPAEKWQFLFSLSGTRQDKFRILDLYQSDITDNRLLPDSSRVLGVNQIKLDLFIRDQLIDQQIFQEGYAIAVYNATNHPGLANDLARIITNLGGNVIISSNSEQLIQESKVVLQDADPTIAKSSTFERLSYLVSPNCFKNVCTSDDPKITRSRGQIVIVLGEDYYLANYRK